MLAEGRDNVFACWCFWFLNLNLVSASRFLALAQTRDETDCETGKRVRQEMWTTRTGTRDSLSGKQKGSVSQVGPAPISGPLPLYMVLQYNVAGPKGRSSSPSALYAPPAGSCPKLKPKRQCGPWVLDPCWSMVAGPSLVLGHPAQPPVCRSLGPPLPVLSGVIALQGCTSFTVPRYIDCT